MPNNLVAIESLTPGMVIVQITKQNGPVKIKKAGLVTSDAMVQGLSEMGVLEVEIDPEQTVEIAPAVHHRTQTQALIRGEHDTTAKFDKSLSERFNRSLFLPTVEGLPSAWQRYIKQNMLLAFVILSGLGVGFVAATSQHWLPRVTHALQATAKKDAPIADANKSTAEELTQSNSDETTSDTEKQPNNSQTTASVDNNSHTQTVLTTAADDKGTEKASDNEQYSPPPLSQPSSPSQPSSASLPASSSSSSSRPTEALAEYEGKVLNENTTQPEVAVSPELIARFNAAVEALDQNGQVEEQTSQTQVAVRDELPRVDQLPVRLLTRLPTMNFSAHMYSSRPADRWVNVNGKQLVEGDWIDDRVQIVNIEARRVVLLFEDEIFTMAALTDW